MELGVETFPLRHLAVKEDRAQKDRRWEKGVEKSKNYYFFKDVKYWIMFAVRERTKTQERE